ncbi:ATP-dependent Clp protease proteolytic subunit [Mucilaginibacter sp.]|jgi:ATP-dependent Clp protease protease subunit|uniref:ATP-dependent Clp protease proteolytic subunit n=1 Tax=Mucilaginibacter sp. TaxID=1882438 RepID=UPI0026379276|nr:ATP-dependent Clp protease proteolytic subunit [Mucilaginibacter sp.]MDB4926891.1 ATP-dependent Clp protease proteolytic subunit [Mucilaginibacter sp.]
MNIDKNEFRKFAVGHCHVQTDRVDNYISGVERSSIPTAMTPYITEEREMRVSQMDVFSRLMMDRIIFMGAPVEANIANIVQAQLLFLQSTDPKKDIHMYINSPGGEVYAGFGIYDTMQLVSPDVATICTGMALSFGAILLCGGAAGKRSALAHSRVMLHQPLGGVQGQASDIEITAVQVLKVKKELYDIISKHSGQDYQKVHEVCDRDHWLIASEAKEFGIIDEVLV